MKHITLDNALSLQIEVRESIWDTYKNYPIEEIISSQDVFKATKAFLDEIAKKDLFKLIYYFDGSQFNKTIPTTVLPLLLQSQTTINRIYATIKYGDPYKRLSAKDKELTLIKYDFYSGSNGFISSLEDAILGAMSDFAKKHPKITAVAAIAAVLGYFGCGYVYDYWDDRAKENYLLHANQDILRSKESDQAFVLNVLANERKNMQILQSINDRFPVADIIKKETYNNTKEFHKVAQVADISSASGIIMNDEIADKLSKQSREKSKSSQVEEVAFVTAYDFNSVQDDFAEIRIIRNNKTIRAKIDKMALNKDDLVELYRASIDRRPVRLALQIRENSKSIKDAVIVHFFAGE